MTIGVGEVPDLIDDQERRAGIVVYAAAQSGVAVEGGEIAEQLSGGSEQDAVPEDHRLVGDVLRQHRLAGAVLADEDDVGCVAEEVERHQRLDGGAVAACRPSPVEVGQRLEAADTGVVQAALQAAADALLLFPFDQRRDPGLLGHLMPVREQAMQEQSLGTIAQVSGLIHRRDP
jgi:hypothetical protein